MRWYLPSVLVDSSDKLKLLAAKAGGAKETFWNTRAVDYTKFSITHHDKLKHIGHLG